MQLRGRLNSSTTERRTGDQQQASRAAPPLVPNPQPAPREAVGGGRNLQKGAESSRHTRQQVPSPASAATGSAPVPTSSLRPQPPAAAGSEHVAGMTYDFKFLECDPRCRIATAHCFLANLKAFTPA